MNMRNRVPLTLLSLVFVISMSQVATAGTVYYNDYTGITVKFVNVRETTQSAGDPDVLFGAPTLSGDSLLFFPSNFTSQSVDGVSDQTHSLLQFTLEAKNNPSDFIDSFVFTELGDAVLTGTGSSVTRAEVGMSGYVTVTEDINGPTFVSIPFTGTINPTNPLNLEDNPGTTLWSGSVTVDVASYAPYAKVAVITFDNNLDTHSEDGTSAMIQKKVINNQCITIEVVVPEPSTFVLATIGLLCLIIRRRQR
ncbi:MAG: PEP-CTERM sorting domain-containing protein [Pirellulales bacterium]|nr:PEP-CTERM sorting domain-containing protein [Pirellulales bacterium]